jgi:Ca2+-binding RTX toxin-like protein
LIFGALSLASGQVRAQLCTVADCPVGSNIDTTPPYIGTNAVDCFIGTSGPDTMLGRGGDDYLCGGGGNDTILGGPGDDTILGEDGDDNLQGDGDSDVILGGSGADTIDGGPGNDFLFGEADTDTLRGGPGDDFMDGGDGNDILEGASGADSLFGGNGDDQLEGQGGNDPILDGGPGEDTINGGPGNDTANGGPGIDFINGGANDDTLSGGDGPDIINGDGGNDTLNGNADNDRLDGGNGTDALFGNSGRDVCLNGENMDFSCELFTHATLQSFGAFEDDGSLIVHWVTSSETGTVGFYLSRERDGEWEALHEGLLPGLLDAPQGGVYDFRVEGGDPSEARRYLLVEVDVNGVQSTHGPFDVTPSSEGESLLEGDSSYARQAHDITPLGRALKAASSEKQRAGDPVAIYFGIEETGLYEVSAAEIAARLGLDEASVLDRIQTGELLLTDEGEAVAWAGSADGSALTFFGVERESLYTLERMYRLSLDAGITMAEQVAAPGALTDGLEYEGSLHIEENAIPGILVAQNPDEDYWFWQLISAAPSMLQAAVVAFDLEAVMGDGTLRVDLHGITDEAHSVEVRLNGTLVGAAQFEGVVPHQATFPVPLSAFNEGENTLSIEPTGPSESMLYFDSADVTYTRGYSTASASLLFGANQDASLEVTGITGDGTQLLDVTDPRRPVRLTGAVATPTGVQLAVETERQYFGLAAGEARTPRSIWNDVPSDLQNPATAADYLIIAPAALYDGAQSLADYREADGLVSKVVELQDIYDEFAFGTPDPNAIRAFLGYANSHWATAPEFVVLVGKGSFDYRDLGGLGGNLLPPIMALTNAGILSSDTKYADFIGDDGLPDVSIGRLPVMSAGELDAIIQQIAEYEDAIDSLSNDVILLADATTAQGDFAASSDDVSEVLPNDWSVTAVYRSEFDDLESTRALFFDEVRKGPRLVNYLGHAGITALGLTETLLGIADLETMTIEGAQPVFAAMTCVASRFAVPGLVSLGEAMLIDDQGAIAVWGPSGSSIHEQATVLARELMNELSSGSETRLGPMINRTFPVIADLEFGRDTIEIYHLLGDPALRVVKADDSTGPGGSGGAPGTGGAGSPNDGLTTAGCTVGWSGHDAPVTLFLVIGALALLLRKRNAKRRSRR